MPGWAGGQVVSSPLSICSLHLTPAPGPGVCLTLPGPDMETCPVTHVFLRYNLSPACPICVPISQPLSEMSQPGETEMTPDTCNKSRDISVTRLGPSWQNTEQTDQAVTGSSQLMRGALVSGLMTSQSQHQCHVNGGITSNVTIVNVLSRVCILY